MVLNTLAVHRPSMSLHRQAGVGHGALGGSASSSMSV
jgi:hypothetical protein